MGDELKRYKPVRERLADHPWPVITDEDLDGLEAEVKAIVNDFRADLLELLRLQPEWFWKQNPRANVMALVRGVKEWVTK